MIKLRIHPKLRREKGCKFGKVLEKCQNYRFFDIFGDIFNKMKDNLCQKCVKGGLLSFQGKIETIAPDFPGKNDNSSTFDPTFSACLSLKSGSLTHTKIRFLK